MNRLSRICDGLIEASWLLAIIVTALAINSYTERTFEPMKVLPLRSIIWIALAVWGMKVISQGGLQFKNISQPRSLTEFFKLPLVIPLVGLFFSILISLAFSVAFYLSLNGAYVRADGALTEVSYLLFFMLIAVNLRRRDQIERIFVTLAFSSFLVASYAILQRLGLDPYAWAVVDVSKRAATTIGHPIFAAAYMTMIFFVLVGKIILAVQDYLVKRTARVGDLIRVILYGLVALLNFTAIWFASSRGPLLGFIAGLAVLVLFLLSYWGVKRALQITLALGVIGFLFLILLNLPTGPLASLRDSPLVGPLGHAFEAESGTGQVRSLIWSGMARVTMPHTPLQYPDGTTDKWNAIRPLIGYGPDTMTSFFEGYYDSKIYTTEIYRALFDRAHNHFWDMLGFYGILGALAKYGLFLSVIFYILLWLGWVDSPFDKKLYWGLSVVGGILGGVILGIWQDAGFVGLGLPLGLLSGLVGIFIRRAFQPRPAEKTSPRRNILLIVFLSAIISHYVELLFGIAVVNTTSLFWMFSALAVVIGTLPTVMEEEKRPVNKASPKASLGFEEGIQQLLVASGLLVSTVILIGYWLIYEAQLSGDVGATLANALTTLPTQPRSESYGALLVFFGFLLLAPALLQIEADSQLNRKPDLPNILLMIGVILLAAAVFWSIRASQLISVASYYQRGQDIDIMIGGVTGIYSTLYFCLLLMLLALGWALSNYRPFKIEREVAKSLPAVSGYVLLPVIALGLSYYFNVQTVYADMLITFAQNKMSAKHADVALPIYNYALELDPTENIFIVRAYDFYTSAALAVNSVPERDRLFETGVEILKRGYDIQPLYVNNSISLAYFYQAWGDNTTDNTLQKSRLAQAGQYYQYAMMIKPNRVDYLLEWAKYSISEGDFSAAERKIESALALNPTYEETYYMAGTFYLDQSTRATDGLKRTQQLDQAMHFFQADLEILAKQGQSQALARLGVARVYAEQGKLEDAKSNYLQALDLGLNSLTWRGYAELANVYRALNDPASARTYFQKAIESAPASQVSALQARLNAIQP